MATPRSFIVEHGEARALVFIESDKLPDLRLGEGEARRVDFAASRFSASTTCLVPVVGKTRDRKRVFLNQLPCPILRNACGSEHLLPENDEWQVLRRNSGRGPATRHSETIPSFGTTSTGTAGCAPCGNRGSTYRNMRIRREALYEQIWRQPMTKVASKLDVSSNYLARVCDSLNVPHPPRGYWARKAAGETLAVPDLPPAKPGDPVEWVRGQAVPEHASFAEYSPPPLVRAAKPKPGSAHHPLVSAWQGSLEQASPDDLGYLWPAKRNIVDAFVTKGTLRAAAMVLNALFNELENRGHTVRLESSYKRPELDIGRIAPVIGYGTLRSWEPGRATIAIVSDIRIGLTLFEPAEHVRVRRVGADRFVRITDLPPVRRYAPQSPHETDLTRDMTTGHLALKAYSPIYDTEWSQQWPEDGPGDLVTRVGDIAAALEAAAPQIAQLAAEADQRAEAKRRAAEAEHRAWRRRERAQARAQARQRSLEELRAIATAWKEAQALRGLLEELSRRAEAMEPADKAELESRITAARALLDAEDAVERFITWRLPASTTDSEEDQDD
jgi:hypothetical protein